jgi:type I restriction enzyme S subunit
MKKGWTEKQLRDVCELINGRAYKKPELLPEGKYPVLRVGNFFTNDHWYYSDLELEPAKYCDHGDLLYAWSASFGPRLWTGGRVIFHYHIWKVLPDPTLIDQKFLYWWFLWDTEQIKKDQGAGTTMIHVAKGSMESRDISIPDLTEQRRIVGILDEAFEGIATAKANAEKNLQNARAVFDSHIESVFRGRSADWTEKRLDEVGTTQTGSTPKTSDRANYGDFVSFVKPADFCSDGSLNYEKDGLSKKGLAEARIVPAGSILMVCIGATIGKCGYCDRDIATNQQINSLLPKKGISTKFVYYQMTTEDFQRRVLSSSAQATLPIINKGKWSALSLSIPPTFDEQEMIASKCAEIDEQTQKLGDVFKRKLAALEELKKSLLDQAFRGEL